MLLWNEIEPSLRQSFPPNRIIDCFSEVFYLEGDCYLHLEKVMLHHVVLVAKLHNWTLLSSEDRGYFCAF